MAGDDTSQNLSDRRRAEESIGGGQELLRLVLATLPVGVSVIDRSGDIVLANAQARLIWGDLIASGQEKYARTTAFWHLSGRPIMSTDWASVRALRDGKTSLNELIDIETFDGRRKTIQNSAAPIRDTDGLIVGSVVVNEDVTERVRAESALREASDRLQYFSRRLLTVQEEERRHLSRELHDEFGQLLAGITLHVQAAKSGARDSMRTRLEECMLLIQQAGTHLRSLVLELRPAMLESAGLGPTLRWIAKQHEERTGTATHVAGELSDVPSELAIACFRAVQEALTNVARHAQARHVWIELCQTEGNLGLVVRDDGRGFDVAKTFERAPRCGHLGLLGMKERVQILGGDIDVVSEPGSGTHIRISFPTDGPFPMAPSRPRMRN